MKWLAASSLALNVFLCAAVLWMIQGQLKPKPVTAEPPLLNAVSISPTVTTTPAQAPEALPCSFALSWASGRKRIHGKITNNRRETIKSLKAVFIVFDRSGNQIDNAYAVTSFLQPGKTWIFDTTQIPENGIRAEVAEIEIR